MEQQASVAPGGAGVDVSNAELVTTGFLADDGGQMPLVIGPGRAAVDLPEWAAAHRDEIEAWLYKHGALLFRGFGLTKVEEFEAVSSAICPELFADYGDLPREGGVEEDLRVDAVPGRPDDPVPQRELAPAALAARSSSSTASRRRRRAAARRSSTRERC